MDKVLFGDNQFFAVNHLSDEKSRQQSMRFRDAKSIMYVLDQAIDLGINTFMCTTHDRIADITDIMRKNPSRYQDFNIFPCMPYAHKYANAVTELGMMGAMKQYMPGNIFSVAAKGGMAFFNKDYSKFMELLIDAELKMFKGINTPVIFIQNVLVDMILGLGFYEIFADFHAYIKKKYNAEAGFITMNLPRLYDVLESLGIENPVICASINKIGFRMSGGKDIYEDYLKNKTFRPVAMQVLAAGALGPKEAIEYLGQFPKIESVLFGASSKGHIEETKNLIVKNLQ
ncbi:hypothetical protein ACE01N_02565 [Saccharicrinis sp. FJH2]|uniref:hypothetical protein n=1 Tax=Saccharicrinis sp. FJH65 TaxID=3344659 RepID=UPI0035F33D2D